MTAATGQIWCHKKTGRRIKLLNPVFDRGDPAGWDWKYATIPRPYDRRATGHIFAFNLIRLYELEDQQ